MLVNSAVLRYCGDRDSPSRILALIEQKNAKLICETQSWLIFISWCFAREWKMVWWGGAHWFSTTVPACTMGGWYEVLVTEYVYWTLMCAPGCLNMWAEATFYIFVGFLSNTNCGEKLNWSPYKGGLRNSTSNPPSSYLQRDTEREKCTNDAVGFSLGDE